MLMKRTARSAEIKEVVFADDFFRGTENGLFPTSRQNRKLLRILFGTPAIRLGLSVRELSPLSEGGNINVVELMNNLGLYASPDGWAASCISDLSSIDLSVLDISQHTLLIGWGLPPSILRYANERGAKFIDVEIHTVRFCRNLHLAMRTNDPVIQRELEDLIINDEVFWSAAATLKSYFARRGQSAILRPDLKVGLFFAQMDIDLAVVGNGRIHRASDFSDQIFNWSKEVDILAIQPHPAQIDTHSIRILTEKIRNSALINCNTYALLCSENLSFVAALSSGVLTESQYFSCVDVRRLLTDDRNNKDHLPANCSPWIPVKLEVAAIDTLRAFTKTTTSVRIPFLQQSSRSNDRLYSEDTLNTILGYRWGLDYTSEGIPDLPALTPEQPLNLGAGQHGSTVAEFGHGWEKPEDWGPWSVGTRAWLVFSLGKIDETLGGKSFELSFLGHLNTSAEGQNPTVRIEVNGRECQIFHKQDRSTEWFIRLDDDTVKCELIVVTFYVEGTTNRGVRLRYINLREIHTVHTASSPMQD